MGKFDVAQARALSEKISSAPREKQAIWFAYQSQMLLNVLSKKNLDVCEDSSAWELFHRVLFSTDISSFSAGEPILRGMERALSKNCSKNVKAVSDVFEVLFSRFASTLRFSLEHFSVFFANIVPILASDSSEGSLNLILKLLTELVARINVAPNRQKVFELFTSKLLSSGIFLAKLDIPEVADLWFSLCASALFHPETLAEWQGVLRIMGAGSGEKSRYLSYPHRLFVGLKKLLQSRSREVILKILPNLLKAFVQASRQGPPQTEVSRTKRGVTKRRKLESMQNSFEFEFFLQLLHLVEEGKDAPGEDLVVISELYRFLDELAVYRVFQDADSTQFDAINTQCQRLLAPISDGNPCDRTDELCNLVETLASLNHKFTEGFLKSLWSFVLRNWSPATEKMTSHLLSIYCKLRQLSVPLNAFFSLLAQSDRKALRSFGASSVSFTRTWGSYFCRIPPMQVPQIWNIFIEQREMHTEFFDTCIGKGKFACGIWLSLFGVFLQVVPLSEPNASVATELCVKTSTEIVQPVICHIRQDSSQLDAISVAADAIEIYRNLKVIRRAASQWLLQFEETDAVSPFFSELSLDLSLSDAFSLSSPSSSLRKTLFRCILDHLSPFHIELTSQNFVGRSDESLEKRAAKLCTLVLKEARACTCSDDSQYAASVWRSVLDNVLVLCSHADSESVRHFTKILLRYCPCRARMSLESVGSMTNNALNNASLYEIPQIRDVFIEVAVAELTRLFGDNPTRKCISAFEKVLKNGKSSKAHKFVTSPSGSDSSNDGAQFILGILSTLPKDYLTEESATILLSYTLALHSISQKPCALRARIFTCVAESFPRIAIKCATPEILGMILRSSPDGTDFGALFCAHLTRFVLDQKDILSKLLETFVAVFTVKNVQCVAAVLKELSKSPQKSSSIENLCAAAVTISNDVWAHVENFRTSGDVEQCSRVLELHGWLFSVLYSLGFDVPEELLERHTTCITVASQILLVEHSDDVTSRCKRSCMPVFLGMAAGLKSGILDERSFLDLCQLVVSALAVANAENNLFLCRDIRFTVVTLAQKSSDSLFAAFLRTIRASIDAPSDRLIILSSLQCLRDCLTLLDGSKGFHHFNSLSSSILMRLAHVSAFSRDSVLLEHSLGCISSILGKSRAISLNERDISLVMNALVPVTPSAQLVPLMCDVLHNCMKFHPTEIYKQIHNVLRSVRIITRWVLSNDESDDVTCADWLGRLLEEFGRSAHRPIMRKYVTHFLADYFSIAQKFTLPAEHSRVLLPGIYALLNICSEDEFRVVNSTQNTTGKQLFKSVLADFKEKFKFTGKI